MKKSPVWPEMAPSRSAFIDTGPKSKPRWPPKETVSWLAWSYCTYALASGMLATAILPSRRRNTGLVRMIRSRSPVSAPPSAVKAAPPLSVSGSVTIWNRTLVEEDPGEDRDVETVDLPAELAQRAVLDQDVRRDLVLGQHLQIGVVDIPAPQVPSRCRR